jgi:Nuclear pore complex assembly
LLKDIKGEEKYASEFLLPKHFVMAMDGFHLFDNGKYRPAVNLLSDPSVDVDWVVHIIDNLYSSKHYKEAFKFIQGQQSSVTKEFAAAVLPVYAKIEFGMAFKFLRQNASFLAPEALEIILKEAFHAPKPRKTYVSALLASNLLREEEDTLVHYCRTSSDPFTTDFLLVYFTQKSKYTDALTMFEQIRGKDTKMHRMVDHINNFLPPLQRQLTEVTADEYVTEDRFAQAEEQVAEEVEMAISEKEDEELSQSENMVLDTALESAIEQEDTSIDVDSTPAPVVSSIPAPVAVPERVVNTPVSAGNTPVLSIISTPISKTSRPLTPQLKSLNSPSSPFAQPPSLPLLKPSKSSTPQKIESPMQPQIKLLQTPVVASGLPEQARFSPVQTAPQIPHSPALQMHSFTSPRISNKLTADIETVQTIASPMPVTGPPLVSNSPFLAKKPPATPVQTIKKTERRKARLGTVFSS